MLIKRLGNQDVSLKQIQTERDFFLENNVEKDIYLSYCGYLKQKYGFKEDEQTILSLRWNISDTYLKTRIDYKKEADVLLKRFKAMGMRLALATVTTNVQLDIYKHHNKNMIEKANFLDIFDCILSKEDLSHKKPHPEVYQKIMERFDVSQDACLIFEDAYLGVLAGKNAGVEVVNIYDQYADLDRDKIIEITDYVIPDYQTFLNFMDTNYNKERQKKLKPTFPPIVKTKQPN